MPEASFPFSDATDENAATEICTTFKSEWNVYTPSELKERCSKIGGGQYLIDGILPDRSLCLMVGDSGLGKSPLVYQQAICVASGAPFLGRTVKKKERVLCLDYENGLGQVRDIVNRLSQHLALPTAPSNLFLFNFNDSPPDWESPGRTADDLIREVKPDLVTIDSLTAFCPEIEEKNLNATRVYKTLRKTIRDIGCTILAVHHLKKPTEAPGYKPESLESGNLRRWFLQARGPRSLINGSDVRLAVDIPKSAAQAALVLRGFGRVRGEIPPIYLSRAFDPDGEALGYSQLTGANLLFNSTQQLAFDGLPPKFAFKTAKQIYGKTDQPTSDLLKKCISLGILHKTGHGQYEKEAE